MSARIMIVDDHEVIRHGIRAILQARPQWEICGEAASGPDAVRLIDQLKPDIVIMDIMMRGMSGLEATKEITKRDPKMKVLIFTMYESGSLSASAQRTGARGFVVKSQAGRDLIRALEFVLGGGKFFDPSGKKSTDESVGSNPGLILLRSALALA